MLRWALRAGICPWDTDVSQERCRSRRTPLGVVAVKGKFSQGVLEPGVGWWWSRGIHQPGRSLAWHSSVIISHSGPAEVPEKSRMLQEESWRAAHGAGRGRDH